MEQRTPLYDRHMAAGGKIVPFAGYLLPVQYGAGVIAEHMAVRNAVGLFDVSHMGEALLEGEAALSTLNALCTNDFTSLAPGRARYTLLCRPNGGVVDDILVYCLSENRYLLVLNAANRHKDVAWLQTHCLPGATLRDISDDYAQLALQGPQAQAVLTTLGDPAQFPLKNYTFAPQVAVAGVTCLLSRTGYTGEDGFELYCAPQDAPRLWDALVAAGALPCGLGARDTLRLEAGMPLYGHELGEDITPLEANLAPFVKLDKLDFIGKAALAVSLPTRTRVGLKLIDRGIAREDCIVYAGEAPVGKTTSGTHAPFLGYAIAMALVDNAQAVLGTQLSVDVRGRRLNAQVVPLPFYKRPKK